MLLSRRPWTLHRWRREDVMVVVVVALRDGIVYAR